MQLLYEGSSDVGISSPPSIYVNEALAVERALEDPDICRLLSSTQQPIRMVVDNAGLGYALRNGLTKSERVQAIIEGLYPVLGRLDTILVVSEDNPADVQSRRPIEARSAAVVEADFAQRVRHLEKALQAKYEGWSWASVPLKKWFARDIVGVSRHDEADPPPLKSRAE